MTTVAITGVAGHVGRSLLAALERHPGVDRIVGLDLVPPRGVRANKLSYRQLDVCDPAVVDALRGVDTVVHLAAKVPTPHHLEAARTTNVAGACTVADAARSAGVGHLIHVSSVFAYGAHPDNDLPLTESSPLRPAPGMHVGEHQHEVESWLAVNLPADARPALTVLRFAMVVGPGIDNVLTRLLEAPRLTTVRGHRPPLQFLHLDDAAGAIVHTIDRRLTGTYNVCSEGWLSFDEVTAIAKKHTIDVPEEVAYSAAERLWRLGVGEHPPGIVDHLMHPWVMSPDAFVATGWRPRASNRDALASAVEEHAAYVSLAGARAERRLLVRAASIAAALAGLGMVRWWRHRRRDRAAGTDAERVEGE